MVEIRLTADQTANLPFPTGCPVWYNFLQAGGGNEEDATAVPLKRGVVKSALLRDNQLFYEVTYQPSSDEDGDETNYNDTVITEEVQESHLGFGATCLVTIVPKHDEDVTTDSLEGEIVMCMPSPTDPNNQVVYTAMIFMDGSQLRYESGIEAARVKFRKVDAVQGTESHEDNITAHNADENAHDETDGKIKVDTMDTTPPPPMSTTQRYVPSSITCSDSVSMMNASKSPISPVSKRSNDSARDSSQKRARYPNEAKHGEVDGGGNFGPISASNSYISPPPKFPNVPRLEITVPLWLQRDRESQKTLFYFLIGKSKNNRPMTRINRESQCKVHIDMKNDIFVPMKIYVEPLNAPTAQQGLKRAREMIQDLFLEYVGHDGSRGRLVYEIARSCWGSHRPSHSSSDAVKDVNPLRDNQSVDYMSVVELSYEQTREKSFHAAHILHKPFLQEIGEVGCDLILVANGFRIPTKLCDPYVLVYGRKYQDVDKAVQMVQRKISDHQGVCGKCTLN
ncbi:hypothetical protein ACHAXM_000874 [Skeletonema potamos]